MKIKIASSELFNSYNIPKYIDFPEAPNVGDKISILSFAPFDNGSREHLQKFLTHSNFDPNAEVIERVWQSEFCVENETNVYLLLTLKFHPEI